MPLLETKGAASAQGFGLTLGGAVPVYIEDVFSTWLYDGNGGTQTITNGIDLAGKGGLVWIKNRNSANSHGLWDTVRGVGTGGGTASNRALSSNLTDPQGLASLPAPNSDYLSAFTASGFTVVDPGTANEIANAGGQTYVSWAFREQPKFFDVVTYTGNGGTQNIAHNLGSVPGCIIVKCTSQTKWWAVQHRSVPASQVLQLDATSAAVTDNAFNSTYPTSTTFSVAGVDQNINGATYVAYLFAHNAGGFGLSGTDNVISCGSFTTDGSGNATVNLGYEPQWVMTKCATNPGFGTNWSMLDIMRGWTASAGLGNVQANLIPNLSNAESNNNQFQPNATGFNVTGSFASSTIIYIAIRRGPMKVPTTGTSVFTPVLYSGSSGNGKIVNVGLSSDLSIPAQRTTVTIYGNQKAFFTRLIGNNRLINSISTAAEQTVSDSLSFTSQQTQLVVGDSGGSDDVGYANRTGVTYDYYNFRRAPSFFDVVCYTGTGSAATQTHNLGVVPELMIARNRTVGGGWQVYASALGATNYLVLNSDVSSAPATNRWNDTAPTSSVFTVGTSLSSSGQQLVAYLFASCPGVSKVGSYTGTGATQTINCGFTAGSRFVLIKATSTTGDWLVWDSARGIVAGNDPYLTLNTTAAEVTTTDWVDTASTGFELSNAGGNLANSNGVSYVFFAVA